MPGKHAHIVLPEDLIADVDALVGERSRSAFLAEVIREAVDRRRLLALLNVPEPVLKDADYPEFRNGSADWVHRLREEDGRLDQERLDGWIERGGKDV